MAFQVIVDDHELDMDDDSRQFIFDEVAEHLTLRR